MDIHEPKLATGITMFQHLNILADIHGLEPSIVRITINSIMVNFQVIATY
jgi:hypothetical protein